MNNNIQTRNIYQGGRRFRKTVAVCPLHGEFDLFVFPDAAAEHRFCQVFPVVTEQADEQSPAIVTFYSIEVCK